MNHKSYRRSSGSWGPSRTHALKKKWLLVSLIISISRKEKSVLAPPKCILVIEKPVWDDSLNYLTVLNNKL